MLKLSMLIKNSYIKDTVLSILTSALLTVSLQLIFLPGVSKTLTPSRFGEIIYIIGVINIFAGIVGGATSNFYLKYYSHFSKEGSQNALYNFNLLTLMLISSIASLILMFTGILGNVYTLILFIVMTLRTYIICKPRAELRFSSVHIANMLLSVTYIISLILFNIGMTRDPIKILILGELVFLIAFIISEVKKKPYITLEKHL
jgi:hypothetical protein